MATKAELVSAIAEIAGTSKKDSEAVLQAFIDVVTKTLSKGEDVTLAGFGSFSVTQRQAREGVNPRTLEKIKIAATKTPKFKAGKKLKEAVK
ncbi:MAG: HU family DNA-binding protein [Proteobacteria bacterium]|jgi:DNA-binding protein HU-beta|nr:HU family DNA-binding protein [Pseudomonadota bacterium]